METLGKKIAEIRKSKGLTQEELAESAKVNLRTIQRIEAGDTTPRGNTLRALCEVLKVNLEEIMDFGKKEDTSFLTYFHLSVLSFLVMPMGNIILPMILWLSKRDKIVSLNEQGINLLNFQIIWTILASASIFLFLLLTLEHSPHRYTFLKICFWLHVANALYALFVTLRIKKGKVRKYYPSLVSIVK